MTFQQCCLVLACLGLVACGKGENAGAPYRKAGDFILKTADPDSTIFIIPDSYGNLSYRKSAYITHDDDNNQTYVLFITTTDEGGNYQGYVYNTDPNMKKGKNIELLAPVNKGIKITIATATNPLPPDVWEVTTQ